MAIRLKELPAILVRNYLAGINTGVFGKPAIGKTETIEAFCARMQAKVAGFRCWTFYANTLSPMDIQSGVPDRESGLLKFYNNESLPNRYRDPDAKGILFIGEFFSGDPLTMKLLQKYINNEDMSGVLRKPVGVVVVVDGNALEHKSGAQQQSRALMSRIEQYEVYTEANDCIEHAYKHGWHASVQTFFEKHPALIDNYDEVFQTRDAVAKPTADARDRMSEEGKRGIWASMRSWERLSRKEFVADQIASPVTLAEAEANLGQGVGRSYDAHKRELRSLVSFDQIMANPAGIEIPAALDAQYAVALGLAQRCQAEQMPAVKAFGERLTLELQGTILRHLGVRQAKGHFNLVTIPAWVKWTQNPALSNILMGI